jgi:hypothetical protein
MMVNGAEWAAQRVGRHDAAIFELFDARGEFRLARALSSHFPQPLLRDAPLLRLPLHLAERRIAAHDGESRNDLAN